MIIQAGAAQRAVLVRPGLTIPPSVLVRADEVIRAERPALARAAEQGVFLSNLALLSDIDTAVVDSLKVLDLKRPSPAGLCAAARDHPGFLRVEAPWKPRFHIVQRGFEIGAAKPGLGEDCPSGTRRSGAMNNQVAHRRNQAQHGWHLAGTEGPRAWHERAPRQGGPTAGARGCQYASSLAQGWPGERYSGRGCSRVLLRDTRMLGASGSTGSCHLGWAAGGDKETRRVPGREILKTRRACCPDCSSRRNEGSGPILRFVAPEVVNHFEVRALRGKRTGELKVPLRVNVMAASVIPQLPNRLEFAGPVRSPGGATYVVARNLRNVLGMSSDTLVL